MPQMEKKTAKNICVNFNGVPCVKLKTTGVGTYQLRSVPLPFGRSVLRFPLRQQTERVFLEGTFCRESKSRKAVQKLNRRPDFKAKHNPLEREKNHECQTTF